MREGCIIATCGHKLGPEGGVDIRYSSESCDAIDGFQPCVVYSHYCPPCAEEARNWPEFIADDAAEAAFWASAEVAEARRRRALKRGRHLAA